MTAPGWTDDLSIRVARDETIESLVDFVLDAERDRTPWPERLEVLITRFALSFDDARVAHDRVLGGRVRAATTNPANAPDPDKDPVAWASYHRDAPRRAPPTPASRSAAWRALVAAASGEAAAARALIDTTDFTAGATPGERDAAERWRDAFDAHGGPRGTNDVLVALRLAQLADATLGSAGAAAIGRRVLIQAATGLAAAGAACRDACGDTGCAPEGTPAWIDGVELAAASRRLAIRAGELGDHELETRALDLHGSLVTGLLGQCRARVGRAMLDSVRCARRAADDARAAELCEAVIRDFAPVVDEWEGEDHPPFDEHRLALGYLLEALDVRIGLGVADAADAPLRARCVALLARA